MSTFGLFVMLTGGVLVYWALGGGKLAILGGSSPTPTGATSGAPVYGPAVPTGYVNNGRTPASGAVYGPAAP